MILQRLGAVVGSSTTATRSSRSNTATSIVRSVIINNGTQQSQQQQQIINRSMGHTVRIIVIDDLPNGTGYKNDVMEVKAGYARNYLLPQKKAVYATKINFYKYNVPDPDLFDAAVRKASIKQDDHDDTDLKAADLLRYYLRNKTLKIWRNVDTTTSKNNDLLSPGVLDVKAIREKLSKQLKITLEDHELIHLHPEPLSKQQTNNKKLSHADMSDTDRETILATETEWFPPVVDNIIATTTADNTKESTTPGKHLGEYLARITLKGGYTVPLKIEVLKR